MGLKNRLVLSGSLIAAGVLLAGIGYCGGSDALMGTGLLPLLIGLLACCGMG